MVGEMATRRAADDSTPDLDILLSTAARLEVISKFCATREKNKEDSFRNEVEYDSERGSVQREDTTKKLFHNRTTYHRIEQHRVVTNFNTTEEVVSKIATERSGLESLRTEGRSSSGLTALDPVV